jgi:hypothetical protein
MNCCIHWHITPSTKFHGILSPILQKFEYLGKRVSVISGKGLPSVRQANLRMHPIFS